MTKNLQQLRKDAGFNSAREFANECDFTFSTYSRYEGEPAIIPTKSAWKIADVLGCTIDEVVGREAPASAGARMQERYDALDAEGRALIEQMMEFAEGKFTERQELERRRLEEDYKRKFTYYYVGLARNRAREGSPLGAGEEATDEFREDFERYVMLSLAEAGMDAREGVKEAEGIMRAYDAWVSGDFYD